MHRSVLLKELTEGILNRPDGIYVDATGGAGGHSAALLAMLGEHATLITADWDERTCERLRKRFEGDARCRVVRARFSELDHVLSDLKIDRIDGLMADLGISSDQLDDAAYGIGFQADGPLDMRMDARQEQSAADLIATEDAEELARIFFEYGEERHSRKIASAIVMDRDKEAITTTGQLKGLAERVLGASYRNQRIHPATRIFQALRIAVNHELDEVKAVLDAPLQRLNPGGRAGVISFHSLEDRIVKWRFRELAEGDYKILTKRPLLPTDEEIEQNSRSRSAKLRIIERT
jgi:16S rRNA (cytosine1402-N4)-methyltransferase